MALHIISEHPIRYALDGVLYVYCRKASIPDTATAAVIIPLLLNSGIRLVAVPSKRYVNAVPFKIGTGRKEE